MMQKHEYVVLVDEQDRQTGTAPKETIHTLDTPLHRAFSLFLFNGKKQLLLQQRSGLKKTWPLVWSNSCCGHPLPGESYESAVKRRALFELGISLNSVIKVSDYRYSFTKDGVMENEICPIFTGFFHGTVQPNKDEVQSVQWIDWYDWIKATRQFPERYSPWCIEETQIMNENKNWKTRVKQLIKKKQAA